MGVADFYSFLGLATEVAELYGAADPITITRAKRQLNRSLLRMSRYKWSFMKEDEDETFTTTSGEEFYTMDSSYRDILGLTIRDPERKLHEITTENLKFHFPDQTESTGTPSHYRRVSFDRYSKGIKIALWPIPDAAFTIYVDALKFIPLMSNNGDDIRSTSGIPEHLIDVVISLALSYMYRRGDAKYNTAKQEAELLLLDALNDDGMSDDHNFQFSNVRATSRISDDDPMFPLNVS